MTDPTVTLAVHTRAVRGASDAWAHGAARHACIFAAAYVEMSCDVTSYVIYVTNYIITVFNAYCRYYRDWILQKLYIMSEKE